MLRTAALLVLFTVALGYRVRRESKADVEAVINAGTEKLREGDFDGFVDAIYADDAILISPDGTPHKGKAAILENFKAKAERFGGLKNVKVTMDTVVEEGDLYVGLGNFQITVTKEGVEVTKNLRSISVFSKSSGEYKVLFNGIYRGDGSGHRHRGDGSGQPGHGHRRHRRDADAEGGVAEKLRELAANAKKLMKEGKVDEAVLIFKEDAKLVKPNGAVLEGREAIKEHYQKMMQKFKVSSIDTETKKVIEDGSLAIELAKTTVTGEKNGQEKTKVLGTITVWQKSGESYEIVLKGVFGKKEESQSGQSGEASSESQEPQ